jgi:hypothetical protein
VNFAAAAGSTAGQMPYCITAHTTSPNIIPVMVSVAVLAPSRLMVRTPTAKATSAGVRLDLVTPSGPQAAEADVLLVATGRIPNSDRVEQALLGL